MNNNTGWQKVAEGMHAKLLEIKCTCVETEECVQWYKSANDYAVAKSLTNDPEEIGVHRLMWMFNNSYEHENHYNTCTRCEVMYMFEEAQDQGLTERVS